MRAQVTISDVSGSLAVAAGWDGAPPPAAQGRVFDDPRGAGLGWRAIAPHAELEKLGAPASEQDWHAHRIACSAPQGGVDFPWGDTFPHEANMDRLNGIDFKKGCYVGQEVVSRVQHRGLARKRITRVDIAGQTPAPGAEITAGEISIGAMGSSSGNAGLALIRLDKAEKPAPRARRSWRGAAVLSVVSPPAT